MTNDFVRLLDGGHYFEAPRWHDGRWWVSDVYGGTVLAVTPGGDRDDILRLDDQPSGIGWLPDGSLLVVSMRDQKVLRRSPDGDVADHALLGGLIVGEANDMVVDHRGRAWVGAVGFDLMAGEQPRPSVLVRVDPDGSTSVAATDLLFPNGAVLADGGRTLIVGETFAARYTAFDVQPDGGLAGRREWAALPQPFGPDGCAVDAEGGLWSADALNGRLVRLGPGGTLLAEITAPDGLGVFAVALGGDDGRTLVLCCAPDYLPGPRAAATEAILLTTQVEVPAPASSRQA